jgi:hypothetical protein
MRFPWKGEALSRELSARRVQPFARSAPKRLIEDSEAEPE